MMIEMDCIYLTREQIASLYRLTFKQGRSKLGAPVIGVQLRGDADATHPVIFDSVLSKTNDVASAVVESSGETNGWWL